MLLKICNENKGWSDVMTLGDISNVQHSFMWNEQYGAYCYAPKNQQEADDILATNYAFAKVVWKVGVIFDGSAPVQVTPAAVSTAKIPPYVKPDLYDAYPLTDLLGLCADSGFRPELNPEDPNQVKVQLHRYYEGRAWAAEEIKRQTARIASLERELAPFKAIPEPPAILTPERAQTPVESVTTAKDGVFPPKKRGRPRKVQELQPA